MVKLSIHGEEKVFEKPLSGLELAQELGMQDAIAMKVNGKLKDLSSEIYEDAEVELLTFKDPDGLEVFRHSSAHLLAQAVKELWPEAKLTIGPVVEEGFYYDIDFGGKTVTPEDIKKIEEKMREIAKRKLPIQRKEITKEEALELFKDNKYKLELINEMPEGETISIYQQGDFVDLCRGPHVPNTGYIKAFKITKISGSYWRADATRESLQRIYGISFPTKEELKAWLQMKEEAKKRDHRKLGEQLDLFSFHEEGPGFPLWHPKGMLLWRQVEQYLYEILDREGYGFVKTPIILNRILWEKSGHWDHYKENMYFTKIDNKDYAVKPMNCPGGVLVYKSRPRSYKELPLKLAEFGLVHRHELAGVLHGLFRVRAFTQDDAHIFCLPEQIKDEIIKLIDLIFEIYRTFGFENIHVELSTRPEDYMGELSLWEKAEQALKDALETKGINYQINEGDGAFYGPKIDFHIRDSMNRSWQCGTIQVDFAMPQNLDITYMGEDGTYNHRPVMIHRAILGSFERFIGIMIEHYGGKFPLWLAPEQVRILSVSDASNAYAAEIAQALEQAGIRVTVDSRSESIPRKVREAQLQKIPLIITIGEKEQANQSLAVRTLDGNVTFGVKLQDLIARITENVEKRAQTFSLENKEA